MSFLIGNNYRLRANTADVDGDEKVDSGEDYLLSQQHYMECLSIRIIESGLDDPRTWEMINALALVLNNSERRYDEIKLYKDFLEIYTRELGPNHHYTVSMQVSAAIHIGYSSRLFL